MNLANEISNLIAHLELHIVKKLADLAAGGLATGGDLSLSIVSKSHPAEHSTDSQQHRVRCEQYTSCRRQKCAQHAEHVDPALRAADRGDCRHERLLAPRG